MSRKEPTPLPEGITKPVPPPAPPRRAAIFAIDDETFMMGMTNVYEACQDIMDSSRSTMEAKTAALDLQLASLRMSVLIREEGFWK